MKRANGPHEGMGGAKKCLVGLVRKGTRCDATDLCGCLVSHNRFPDVCCACETRGRAYPARRAGAAEWNAALGDEEMGCAGSVGKELKRWWVPRSGGKITTRREGTPGLELVQNPKSKIQECAWPSLVLAEQTVGSGRTKGSQYQRCTIAQDKRSEDRRQSQKAMEGCPSDWHTCTEVHTAVMTWKNAAGRSHEQ